MIESSIDPGPMLLIILYHTHHQLWESLPAVWVGRAHVHAMDLVMLFATKVNLRESTDLPRGRLEWQSSTKFPQNALQWLFPQFELIGRDQLLPRPLAL